MSTCFEIDFAIKDMEQHTHGNFIIIAQATRGRLHNVTVPTNKYAPQEKNISLILNLQIKSI